MIPKQDLPAFYNVVINADSHSLDSYHVLESFKFQPGIIVSLKRPVENLISHLREKGIELHEETHFIDGISKSINNHQKVKNCVYLSSPDSLKELSSAIAKLANRLPLGERFLIFDSPQIALREKTTKSRLFFLNHITNQLRDYNLRGVFMTNHVSDKFKNQLAYFADCFIQL